MKFIANVLKVSAVLAGAVCVSGLVEAGGLVRSAGPRFGIVYATDEVTRKTLQKEYKTDPMLSAWGWQFEYEYLNTTGATTGLVEIVPLALGLESGIVIPSLTGLVGVRFGNGLELGFGPNIGVVGVSAVNERTGEVTIGKEAGVGMAGALGMTLRSGEMSFPINLAAVRNTNGYRVSLLVGWHRWAQVE